MAHFDQGGAGLFTNPYTITSETNPVRESSSPSAELLKGADGAGRQGLHRPVALHADTGRECPFTSATPT
ncbi:MAG: hypothetical protein ACE5FV_09185 [Woeseia sp.]